MFNADFDFSYVKKIWSLKLVAEFGSVKEAAVHTGVTSSAVSQSITSLEKSLKRRLLVRKRNRLHASPFAQDLIEAAEPAFKALHNLQKKISEEDQSPILKMSSLTLGTTASLAIDVLPDLLARLRRRSPGIKMKILIGRSSQLSRAVRKGDIAMALVADNDQMAGLNAVKIAEERMGFYCSSRRDIAEHGWALTERLGVGVFPPDQHGGYPAYFLKLLRPFGARWRPALTTESYEALRALAASGSLVSVLSTRVAAVHKGDLVELRRPVGADAKSGHYNISLISDQSLSHAQFQFITDELGAVMGEKFRPDS